MAKPKIKIKPELRKILEQCHQEVSTWPVWARSLDLLGADKHAPVGLTDPFVRGNLNK